MLPDRKEVNEDVNVELERCLQDPPVSSGILFLVDEFHVLLLLLLLLPLPSVLAQPLATTFGACVHSPPAAF